MCPRYGYCYMMACVTCSYVQQRSIGLDTGRRGLQWLLDEESIQPGSNDYTFLERVQNVHGVQDEYGESESVMVC